MQAFPIYIGTQLQGVEGPSYARYQGVSLGLLPPMHPLRLLVSEAIVSPFVSPACHLALPMHPLRLPYNNITSARRLR